MRPANHELPEMKGNHTWTREGGYQPAPAPEQNLPTAEDLDAVAAEQEAADATE